MGVGDVDSGVTGGVAVAVRRSCLAGAGVTVGAVGGVDVGRYVLVFLAVVLVYLW